MDKKILSFLVLNSYTHADLDEKKVSAIAQRLNRRQLKEYVRSLKTEEKRRSLEVYTATPIESSEKKSISRTFPGKKIAYMLEPSLIAGIRIRNNDDIYELDIKDRFESFISNIADDI